MADDDGGNAAAAARTPVAPPVAVDGSPRRTSLRSTGGSDPILLSVAMMESWSDLSDDDADDEDDPPRRRRRQQRRAERARMAAADELVAVRKAQSMMALARPPTSPAAGAEGPNNGASGAATTAPSSLPPGTLLPTHSSVSFPGPGQGRSAPATPHAAAPTTVDGLSMDPLRIRVRGLPLALAPKPRATPASSAPSSPRRTSEPSLPSPRRSPMLSPVGAAKHAQRPSAPSSSSSSPRPSTTSDHVVVVAMTPSQTAVAAVNDHRRRRWCLSTLGLQRWYGQVLNSYFAFWLVVCALSVVALFALALLLPAWANKTRSKTTHDDECQSILSSIMVLHYISLPSALVLALPAVFPSSSPVALYETRDQRLVRRPYLQVCELVIVFGIVHLSLSAAGLLLALPTIIKCRHNLAATEMLQVAAVMVLCGILSWQIILFCRFLSHLKLQADQADDATHTSKMNSQFKRFLAGPNFTARRRQRNIFKKRLFRAVARGDLSETQELLQNAQSELGVSAISELYRPPSLWLYAFAMSAKNPLHIAAMRGHYEICELLLSHGFDPNALDKVARVNFNIGLLFRIMTRFFIKTQDGLRSPLSAVLCSVLVPPLHGAVAAGHVDIVRLLLDHGANANALSRASFYASSSVIPAIFVADDPVVVRLLVARGANILHVATASLAERVRTKVTALQRSAFTLRAGITEYLLEYGADVALTPLHAAAAQDDVRTVKKLLARGAQVDSLGERVRGVQSRTPLHWAAVAGQAKAAAVLLQHGADPNADDRYGRTPLHWAARNNHAAVVAILLDHGASAVAEDHQGVPVLTFASEADGVSSEVISYLLSAGASVKHKLAGSGDTALHIALQRENRTTALSLIRCGASLMETNFAGRRAVDCTTSTELQFSLKKEAGSRDVMISYTHSHFAFAKQVREYLESACSLTCWMDTMDPSGIGGGAVWREEIGRGIHNCSLVLSIVCEGYSDSEWCVKELALAKWIRKPVVALVVEDTGILGLDDLIPPTCRLPFREFIRGKYQEGPRSVTFDVDEVAFAASWHTVLPKIKEMMGVERHVDMQPQLLPPPIVLLAGEECKAHDGPIPEELVLGAPESASKCVFLYSPFAESPLRDRLREDLRRLGWTPLDFHPSMDKTIAPPACQILVVVLESISGMESKDERHEAMAALTSTLTAVKEVKPRIRVHPVVARPNFLSFSNLYTLSRAELLYYVDGLGQAHAIDDLVRHLQALGSNRNRSR